ncbi:B-type lectin plumieribetin-like [Sebastes fasciatus]|uniref:B-type lectin plumieribetin-like n=1 Tax=Sebastes fasciatus TaxID=394691 RepID=UPI003D9E10CA
MSKNYLSKDDELRRGDYLMSNNGQWKAIFQDDGNFVLYGWKPVWDTKTNESDSFRLCMQADSNLVMYNEAGTPKWDTKTFTNEKNVCRLQVTDDGQLVLYRGAKGIWKAPRRP